jgi:hypothetical protein
MKQFYISLLFFGIAVSYGQVKDSLNLNFTQHSYELPEFSYYSKNYNKIFDYYQYTFDAQKFSKRSVYVSSDNRLYFGENGGFIMDMSHPSYNTARINRGYAYDLGGLYHGLKNIFEMEKDYSVKRRNSNSFTDNP